MAYQLYLLFLQKPKQYQYLYVAIFMLKIFTNLNSQRLGQIQSNDLVKLFEL